MTTNYYDHKLPADILDYAFDWSRFLPAGDAIQTAEVTVDGPDESLTASGTVIDGKLVSFWLQGGTPGVTYELHCHIVTTAGRDVSRKATLPIANPDE